MKKVAILVCLTFSVCLLWACEQTPGNKLNAFMKKQVEIMEGDEWKEDMIEWCGKNGGEMKRLVGMFDSDKEAIEKDFDKDYYENTYKPALKKREKEARKFSKQDNEALKDCFVH